MSTEADHRPATAHPPTLEFADSVETEEVKVVDLEAGDYVLLPEDYDEMDIPLVMADDYEEPLLVRVAMWDGPGLTEVVFDSPADDEVGRICPGEGELIRRVLPDQDHPRWGHHAGD